jgi:hypothetical protein
MDMGMGMVRRMDNGSVGMNRGGVRDEYDVRRGGCMVRGQVGWVWGQKGRSGGMGMGSGGMGMGSEGKVRRDGYGVRRDGYGVRRDAVWGQEGRSGYGVRRDEYGWVWGQEGRSGYGVRRDGCWVRGMDMVFFLDVWVLKKRGSGLGGMVEDEMKGEGQHAGLVRKTPLKIPSHTHLSTLVSQRSTRRGSLAISWCE